MKKTVPAILLLASLFWNMGCSKNHYDTPLQGKPAFIKDTSALLFKLIPLAANDIKIQFLYPHARTLQKLIFKKDTTVLGSYSIGTGGNNSYTAEINFPFDSTKQYTIQVQTNAVSDTIYQYTLPPYSPVFRSAYHYQKILSLNQSMGVNGMDISPSRNYLFITDDSSNILITKRVSLQTYAVDTVSTRLYTFPVRAVSDSELLVQYGTYQNRLLGYDSMALMRYNIRTTQSQFIDWTSNNYGRISRIKNNRVLITAPNPISNGGFTSLNNLSDGSKVTYTANQIYFPQIREANFEAIYNNNFLVNPISGSFVTLLPNTATEGIEFFDSISQYTVTSHYLVDNVSSASYIYTGYIAVYSNLNKVYQSESLTGRIFYIPRAQQIKNNTLLFYQYFDYDTAYHTDGYYSLNLATKNVTLLQSDNSSPYYTIDFLFDDTHIYSVRYDGVYVLVKQ